MQILLPVLVGAVIGLFTNWLAIVMLFRPWKEMRLFGMRLPMTPGLIPRRQPELADKLGEIVEHDLLTPEGLAKSISRPELEFAVKRAAVAALAGRLEETQTAGEIAARLFGEQAMEVAEHFLTTRAVAFLQSESGRERLEGLADSLFDHLRGSLSSEEVRRELAKGFAAPLHQNLAAGTIVWADIVPEGSRTMLEGRLQQQLGPFLEGAANWLTAPAVVAAISKMLQEKVENIPLVGPIAKGFLTPDRVLDDIVPRLQAVVTSAQTRELIASKLHDMVGSFWTRPVGHTLGTMTLDELSSILEKVLQAILERALTEQTASREMFRELIVNGLVSGANEKTVGDLVRRLVEALSAWNVRDLYIKHTDRADRMVTKAWRFLRGEVIENIPALLEALAIRTVVREQVMGYPIQTLEKLILSVVNKELRMITLLGGVLGAVIGLVQALLLRL